jgi:hypothetical protein
MGCCWWNCRGISYPEFVRNCATVSRSRNFFIYLRILSKVGSRIRIHALAADAVGQTSLDNFVGAGEDRLRDGEAERLGGL